MEQNLIEKLQPFWDEWTIEETLGKGGFGNVYKICKDSYGMKQYSALKVITIEHEKQKEQVFKIIESSDIEKVSAYYNEVISDIVNEINLLYKLKGHGNVVSYEDYKIIDLGNFNWVVLIRMELAEPFDKYLNYTSLNRMQIINFAFEMLNSLEVCHNNNIIHRDIKEQNIFISTHGKFKLGDFGVAKESFETNNFYTQVGTYAYSAPEVIKGLKYDNSVDIYSLGIILYKLLNNGRFPFVEGASFNDIQKAIGTRLSGEKLNLPINANDDLGKIILKACEFKVQNRYKNIYDFKNDLEEILDTLDDKYLNKVVFTGFCYDKSQISHQDSLTKSNIKSKGYTNNFNTKSYNVENSNNHKKTLRKKIFLFSTTFAIIFIIILISFIINNTKDSKKYLSKNTAKIEQANNIIDQTINSPTSSNNPEPTLTCTASTATSTKATSLVSPSNSIIKTSTPIIQTQSSGITQSPIVNTSKPIENGTNLLINPNFNGKVNWTLLNETPSIDTSSCVYNGILTLQHQNESQADGYYQNINNFIKGMDYIIEADVKCKIENNGKFEIKLSQVSDNGTIIYEVGRMVFSNSDNKANFEKYSFKITIPPTDDYNYRLHFKFTGLGTIEIDNAKFYSK